MPSTSALASTGKVTSNKLVAPTVSKTESRGYRPRSSIRRRTPVAPTCQNRVSRRLQYRLSPQLRRVRRKTKILRSEVFSSLAEMRDIKTVNMNVVALRIAVRPEPISARSQTIRLKEMALFNRAVSTNALETLQPASIRTSITIMSPYRITTASSTRATTMVNVGRFLAATPRKKTNRPRSSTR